MKRIQYFIDEFVIGLGFLSGLWIAVGVDPEAEIFKAFSTIINTLNPNFEFNFLFFIIPTIILIGSILEAYFMGGKFGLVAVVCGFIGGFLILISPIISLVLLLVGMFIGEIAVD